MKDTEISISQLETWGSQITTLNEEAIENVSAIEKLITTLPDAYQTMSTDSIVANVSNDVTNVKNEHESMKKLQEFLGKVVENAKNS